LKIHVRFLKALEEGNYSIFSSPVHLKGFLKNYSSFLSLPVDEILAFFRREYPIEKNVTLTDSLKPLSSPVILVTPERIVSATVIFLTLVFFGYLFFQYRSFTNAPGLTVVEPSRDFKTTENITSVSGQTSKDATLKINGQEINLTEEGNFSTAIALLDGINVLNFAAKNKLDKETRVTRTIILEKPVSSPLTEEQASPSAVVSDRVNLKIHTSPNASWIEVYALGGKEPLFQGLMVAGVTRDFSDSVGIKLRTGNGGSTSVTLNGNNLGPMGQEGEIVEKEFKK
jgi:cytoskeletal protein RodZ